MKLPWDARDKRKQDLDEEIQSHLQMAARDREARGEPADQAAASARCELGNSGLVREVTHDQWRWGWLEALWQDIRFAARMLRKSPGFTAVAVLTLALGIGANTAIFSFIDAVILRPLPVHDPQHLVVFSWSAHERPKYHGHSGFGDCVKGVDCSLSLPFFQTVRAHANSFSGMAAFAGPLEIDFSGNGHASIARGQFVSGDYFSTLGVHTFLGRPLGPSDDSPSAPAAIVLNYGYWQRAFGGDRSVLGRTVRLNNTPAVIVGVADPRFTNLTPGNPCDFFMPFALTRGVRSEWWDNQDRVSDAGIWWVVIVGRLKPGISIGQAQAEAGTIFRNEMLRGATPMSKEADAPAIKLRPADRGLDGASTEIAPTLYLLMVAVGLVLLIACANVAGLMLARSATRQKEMAVRLALGAGRRRIVRQLLTESVMLSLVGGACGVLLAIWGVNAVFVLLSNSPDEPFPFVIATDWRLLAFTIGVTTATGILFGLAPALRGALVDLTPSLKENSSSLPFGGARNGRWFRLGDALVVAQVALSIVMLIGAGLLVRTLRNLHALNPGFDSQNVLLFGINPPIAGYKDQQTAQLYSDLQQRFAALPGIISASYSAAALLSGNHSSDDVHLDGAPPKSNVNAEWLAVGLDFFSTMRIPMLAGRTFTPADFASAAATNAAVTAANATAKNTGSAGPSRTSQSQAQAAPVPVIINEIFARQFFPNQDPIGEHMSNAQGDKPPVGPRLGYLIVGIAGNTKYSRLRSELEPTIYFPQISNSAHFELRSAVDPAALITLVRETVSRVDNNLPLFDVRTQTEEIEQALFLERLMTRLSSFFGFLALALACIGLYGLLSYEVSRRTRELGIRVALGARQRDVLRLVVWRGILLVLVGGAVGTGVAFVVTRYLASVLFGVRPTDPLTLIAVAILFALVGLAACYVPARRAMRVDPMIALRYE